MRFTDRKTLTYTLLLLPMIAVAHLFSACDNSNGSAPAKNQLPNATPVKNHTGAITAGTIAVSSEALFDFLHVATPFEFWNCVSSGNTEITYIALDSKDVDTTDEGFNPLLLMGLLREPQLVGDPRALNEDERSNDVKLRTIPVSLAATGSDSTSMTLHANNDYTPSADDTMVYLTKIRTGPGRAFTAEDQINNIRLTCSANNVDANVML